MRFGVCRCVPISLPHEPGDSGRSLADKVGSTNLEAALPFRTAWLKYSTAPLADGELSMAADLNGRGIPQFFNQISKERVYAAV